MQATDCELTITARTPDSTASGWQGQANRDWTTLTPSAIAAQAILLANQGRNPKAVEPGRRVVILGPTAVGQIMHAIYPLFDAHATDIGDTPFSNQTPNGRTNKLGLQVFDARLTMVSDPADPGGGYPPFFEDGGIPGMPIPRMTWVERSILKNLAYNVSYALDKGKAWCDTPKSVRVMPVPGTPTLTIPEMIADCKAGIYVNRLSDLAMLDPKSGVMTGVTRDGCFLVKDGKIDTPVKNFRFTDSPFFFLNNFKAIGEPERVALGYSDGMYAEWPLPPVIVPPVMVQDFNFTALGDAV